MLRDPQSGDSLIIMKDFYLFSYHHLCREWYINNDLDYTWFGIPMTAHARPLLFLLNINMELTRVFVLVIPRGLAVVLNNMLGDWKRPCVRSGASAYDERFFFNFWWFLDEISAPPLYRWRFTFECFFDIDKSDTLLTTACLSLEKKMKLFFSRIRCKSRNGR